ncbi:flavohemoglobin expression-modulating QEGLA motif protein [Patescibacteria group bacterium]|nr:flavohemoglobin expression-modulating QEGLA motif protein [Patescibacteria group bacterium]
MKDQEPKIDAHYYEKIAQVLDDELALHHALGPINYQREKKKFLSSSNGCPIFKYQTITDKNYKYNLDLLKDLENDLRFELNSDLKQLYLAKIEEMREELEFRAVIGRDAKIFHRKSVWLFGMINSDDYQEAKRRYKRRKKEEKEEKNFLDAEKIKDVFNRALLEFKISGWEAMIEPKAFYITINDRNPHGHKIEIPPAWRETPARLEEILEHEIVTHLCRRRSGELSKLALLGHPGADKSHQTDEGLAIYGEKQAPLSSGKTSLKHITKEIAMGAAMEGRNFRKTHNFLLDLGLSPKAAWYKTFRVFRGVANTSKGDGFICTLDSVYRLGEKEINNFVKEKGDSALDRLWVGKIGIKHLPIMKKLGITEPAIKRRYLKIEDLMPKL